MNGSQILNMILRMVMRRGINTAINAGINRATRPRHAPDPDQDHPGRAEQQRIRAARRARRAAREQG